MTHHAAPLAESVKAQALARIGYFVTTKRKQTRVDSRAVLAWFAELAKENFDKIDAGKLIEWQEEYRALQEEGVQFSEYPPPSRDKLVVVQETVRKHFVDLLDRGSLSLGPFSVMISIHCPLNVSGLTKAVRSRLPALASGEQYQPSTGEALVYLLSRCLAKDGDLLKRCEYCRSFFIQSRRVRSSKREQKHCNHFHRTQAWKEKHPKRAMKKAKSHSSHRGRRLKHGQKRR